MKGVAFTYFPDLAGHNFCPESVETIVERADVDATGSHGISVFEGKW